MPDNRVRFPSGIWLILATAIAGSIAGAGLAWARFAASINVDQPLTITACTPDTYDPPAPGDRGPDQSECDIWFEPTGDSWQAGQPFTVTGQVCNHSDEPVAYTLTVGWHLVGDGGAQVDVINIPISYEPGCHEPYSFEYVFPQDFMATTPDGSLGRWRLVGRAQPTNPSRWDPYQWDVTKTVEIRPAPDSTRPGR